MTFFLCTICFRTHQRIHKKLTVRGGEGGGSTLTVSPTLKYPFFGRLPLDAVVHPRAVRLT